MLIRNYIIFTTLIISLFSMGCKKDKKSSPSPVEQNPDTNLNPNPNPNPIPADTFIRGADFSFVPEIESSGTSFLHNGQAEDPLQTFKSFGGNTIRLRLWHQPVAGRSGLEEVKTYAARVKAKGLKVWLTVHFSDTWADPGHQTKPAAWNGLNFSNLKDSLSAYMGKVAREIKPDILQIGNETNNGLLWPDGKLSTQPANTLLLFKAAISEARAQSPQSKLMLHYAGPSGSDWFFNQCKDLDFDYIGISYYPIWHGKNMETLKTSLNSLGQTYKKKVLVAETSYPFTFGWNDWTNNVVGLESQILTAYPASPEGQKEYLHSLKAIVKSTSHGIGFCYWGGEWIAFKGNQASNGSSWENQALWDFDRKSLPALSAFSKD
jgi:arabinogalactan endo-1,4-beta-galactosidase